MVDEKNVFIATPMYGGMCTAPYTVGMIDTLDVLRSKGFTVSYSFLANESLITRGRNELVHRFLSTSNAKYFLFIDADIGFKGKDVLRLIESGKEFICGAYPKKIVDWSRINNVAKFGATDLQNYAASYVINMEDGQPLNGGIVEVKHAGTGFMMLHRSVFEKMLPYVKEYRVSTIKNPDGTLPNKVKEFFALDIVGEDDYFLSEDYFFCNLWKKIGGKVYVDLDISLSHFGSYEYKGNVFVGGINPGNQ